MCLYVIKSFFCIWTASLISRKQSASTSASLTIILCPFLIAFHPDHVNSVSTLPFPYSTCPISSFSWPVLSSPFLYLFLSHPHSTCPSAILYLYRSHTYCTFFPILTLALPVLSLLSCYFSFPHLYSSCPKFTFTPPVPLPSLTPAILSSFRLSSLASLHQIHRHHDHLHHYHVCPIPPLIKPSTLPPPPNHSTSLTKPESKIYNQER